MTSTTFLAMVTLWTGSPRIYSWRCVLSIGFIAPLFRDVLPSR